MPHSNSAKKRVRQNEQTRMANKASKSEMRTQMKKTKQAIEAGDAELAKKEMVATARKLDKAAKRNVIHPNKAAREKSHLQREINEMKK